MRVLITGATGQLGQALVASVPDQLRGSSLELLTPGRHQLDLADASACEAAVRDFRPDWVLNLGAYTAVDRAEQDADLAQAVNADAPKAIAQALADQPGGLGRMLQVSTDFVFDGAQGTPYLPDAPVAPLGVYGFSKAAAEQAVLAFLGPSNRVHVLRTGWVYGPVGSNFCRTMLRLHRERAAKGQPLAVVADQVGCPTSTLGLAEACWRLLTISARGATLPPVLHWSDAGAASWYDFAVAIGELGQSLGLLEQTARVLAIPTADYPTPARRPSYSLLDCTATRQLLELPAQHWRQALRSVLERLSVAQAP